MAIFNESDGDDQVYGARKDASYQELDGGEGGRLDPTEQSGRASPTPIFNPFYTGRPHIPTNGSKYAQIDRQEIIRKIKSRGSRPTSPELERPGSGHGRKRHSPTVLPAVDPISQERPQSPNSAVSNQAIGMQIERPRSALHRGDFRDKEDGGAAFQRFGDGTGCEPPPPLATSPVVPWHSHFPPAAIRVAKYDQRPPSPPGLSTSRPTRARAISNAANFAYKPPTSPLAQSSRPDTPEPGPGRNSRSPDRSRRHTFSPQYLQHFQSALEYPASARGQTPKQPPPLRSERTFPYQAHQPRRSLNSFASLPQTPAPGTRRPSLSDSPLHHAPMVGSYEESILRGRMSTTPSKPLNFVAQIGVLGKGKCKSNLRCPPHVTVPFPAVFYSYNSGQLLSADQPSPYVGLVDLENNLPAVEPLPEKRRQRLEAVLSDEGSRASSRTREEGSASDAQVKRRRRQKQKRRSGSPKAPPGGSYRIPQQGQLQIIIKNPNKTAVKLFLVPYDLSQMEPGQKTFIRQRSYSAGPIIDMLLSSRKNLGTDRPEAALSASDDPNERPTLRYLIHLHICCPSKGRYFLYKSIRVVFANRVPDGKEKLRNEIQLPEPRYSVYKPSRASNISTTTGGMTPTSRSRRPSEVDQLPPTETTWPFAHRTMAQSLPSNEYSSHYSRPTQALPCHSTPLPPLESRPVSRQMSDGMELDSERSQETQSTFTSPRTMTSGGGEGEISPMVHPSTFDDPFVFRRDHSRERGAGGSGWRSESLLSQRLRDLVVRGQSQGHTSDGAP